VVEKEEKKNYLNKINQLGISDEQPKELFEQRI